MPFETSRPFTLPTIADCRLQAAGFEFGYPEIEGALRALVESNA